MVYLEVKSSHRLASTVGALKLCLFGNSECHTRRVGMIIFCFSIEIMLWPGAVVHRIFLGSSDKGTFGADLYCIHTCDRSDKSDQ